MPASESLTHAVRVMISAILIYGQRGEILASRVYREGLRRAVTDAFRVQVISNADVTTPILTMGSTSFLHIRHNQLYIVAVTRADIDAIAVYETLYRFCEVCTAQLGGLDDSVCYRFVAEIYEILDELIDFGFPQSMDAGFSKLPSVDERANLKDGMLFGNSSGNLNIPGPTTVVSSLKRTLTSAKPSAARRDSHSGQSRQSSSGGSQEEVPWRRNDIKHRRNEIYLDVIEKFNAVFEPRGSLLSANVNGLLKVKAHLSGLPNCQVDLDNFDVLENSQLHACANHAAFEASGVVQFVPPEGEFDLLRYRVTSGLKMPLRIENFATNTSNEHIVRVRCNLDPKKHLSNLVIIVPLPPTSTSSTHKLKCSNGKAKYAADRTAVEWKVARLTGQHEATLRITGDSVVGNGPIGADFSVSMFTCSSLRVQSLQVVEESKYATLKWVRYLTESGVCEARTK